MSWTLQALKPRSMNSFEPAFRTTLRVLRRAKKVLRSIECGCSNLLLKFLQRKGDGKSSLKSKTTGHMIAQMVTRRGLHEQGPGQEQRPGGTRWPFNHLSTSKHAFLRPSIRCSTNATMRERQNSGQKASSNIAPTYLRAATACSTSCARRPAKCAMRITPSRWMAILCFYMDGLREMAALEPGLRVMW